MELNALELIKILANIIQEHGDCPVSLFEDKDAPYGTPIQSIDWEKGVIRFIQ